MPLLAAHPAPLPHNANIPGPSPAYVTNGDSLLKRSIQSTLSSNPSRTDASKNRRFCARKSRRLASEIIRASARRILQRGELFRPRDGLYSANCNTTKRSVCENTSMALPARNSNSPVVVTCASACVIDVLECSTTWRLLSRFAMMPPGSVGYGGSELLWRRSQVCT